MNDGGKFTSRIVFLKELLENLQIVLTLGELALFAILNVELDVVLDLLDLLDADQILLEHARYALQRLHVLFVHLDAALGRLDLVSVHLLLLVRVQLLQLALKVLHLVAQLGIRCLQTQLEKSL
jgi:hypothetical protein